DPRNFGDVLDERCRQGVLRQQLKRLRHTLLGLRDLDALLKEVFLFLRDAFDAEGRPLNLFYLDVVPGGALEVHADPSNPAALAADWLEGHDRTAAGLPPLIAPQKNLGQVLQNRLRALTTDVRALLGQTLTGSAAVQLLVPVLLVLHP